MSESSRTQDHYPLSEAAVNLELGKYRHFKGREYLVLWVAPNRDGEEEVIYQLLYGDESVHTRLLAEFTESVSVGGSLQPRFCFEGDE